VAEAEDARAGFAEERAYRRGFRAKDRRDDYALDLFTEAEANWHDHARVDRILLELGRFYNPLVNGPVVDLASRQRIMELLWASRPEEAAALLRDCRRRYEPIDASSRPEGAAD
jgi:hypothetical protein